MLKKVDEMPKSFDYLLGGFLTHLHDRTSKSRRDEVEFHVSSYVSCNISALHWPILLKF